MDGAPNPTGAERKYDYCRIYVAGPAGRNELRHLVAQSNHGISFLIPVWMA
jgi:hypothetical protein